MSPLEAAALLAFLYALARAACWIANGLPEANAGRYTPRKERRP